jgi:hypothetical protein
MGSFYAWDGNGAGEETDLAWDSNHAKVEAWDGCFSVLTHPRARRYSFVATIELTDVQSEAKIQERTSDLSLFGCRVETHEPFPTGAKARIRIAHRGANFVALGRVSYTTSDGGMGIAFTQIEPTNQLILEKWVEELRGH